MTLFPLPPIPISQAIGPAGRYRLPSGRLACAALVLPATGTLRVKTPGGDRLAQAGDWLVEGETEGTVEVVRGSETGGWVRYEPEIRDRRSSKMHV